MMLKMSNDGISLHSGRNVSRRVRLHQFVSGKLKISHFISTDIHTLPILSSQLYLSNLVTDHTTYLSFLSSCPSTFLAMARISTKFFRPKAVVNSFFGLLDIKSGGYGQVFSISKEEHFN